MDIKTVDEFNAALKTGPYAWPGGYPHYFITKDGGALSFKAAQEEADNIRDSIATGTNDGWLVTYMNVNWENADLTCDHSGERIESAYAEPDEEGGA